MLVWRVNGFLFMGGRWMKWWNLGGGNSNIFDFQPYKFGDDPIWRAYFSDGLVQPPTRNVHNFFFVKARYLCIQNCRSTGGFGRWPWKERIDEVTMTTWPENTEDWYRLILWHQCFYITCIYCSFHSTVFIIYTNTLYCVYILEAHFLSWEMWWNIAAKDHGILASNSRALKEYTWSAVLRAGFMRASFCRPFLTLRLRDSNIHGGNQAGIYLDTWDPAESANHQLMPVGNSWQRRLELIVFWKGYSQGFRVASLNTTWPTKRCCFSLKRSWKLVSRGLQRPWKTKVSWSS